MHAQGGNAAASQFLVARSGSWWVAIAVTEVVETMRPLAIARISHTVPFVRGVAVVRGAPTPVVGLDLLLEGNDLPAKSPEVRNLASDHEPEVRNLTSAGEAARFILLRGDGGYVALEVDEVVDLRTLDPAEIAELPALVSAAREHGIEGMAAGDEGLLAFLRAAMILPAHLRRQILSDVQ